MRLVLVGRDLYDALQDCGGLREPPELDEGRGVADCVVNVARLDFGSASEEFERAWVQGVDKPFWNVR